jgi:hypothetical protein
MRFEREALRLGLQIVTAKLAEAMGVPSLNAMAPLTPPTPPPAQAPMQLDPRMFQQAQGSSMPGMANIDSTDIAAENEAELPTTNAQVRDRSAKIAPGRVITTQ